jgi:hypothetical protein
MAFVRLTNCTLIGKFIVLKIYFKFQSLLKFLLLQKIDEMVELNLKTRFIFILLGPKNENIDYLEIGRCIGTLMQNKVKLFKKK